jgi:hypothetical protein
MSNEAKILPETELTPEQLAYLPHPRLSEKEKAERGDRPKADPTITRVIYQGRLQRPRFTSRADAEAYVQALDSGRRRRDEPVR